MRIGQSYKTHLLRPFDIFAIEIFNRLHSDSATLAKYPSATTIAYMYHFLRLCILVTTFILYVGTNALPTQSLARAAPISVALNATRVECFRPVLIGSRRAATRDCLYAVLKLPEGSNTGVFHSSGFGPYDQYTLPVVERHSSCMATVSIPDAFEDYSSWSRISQVLSQLTAICSTGEYPLGSTGGVVYVGQSEKIRLTVERNQEIDLDVGNGTFGAITAD